MIIDKLENLYKYKDVNPYFSKVLDFIAKTDLSTLEVGKKTIDDTLWYNSQEYIAKDPSDKYESHVKYIDIQVMISGEEIMYYSKDTPIINELNEKDFYSTISLDKSILRVSQGYFVIFFPGELHNPGLKANDKLVKKVVFKVLNK